MKKSMLVSVLMVLSFFSMASSERNFVIFSSFETAELNVESNDIKNTFNNICKETKIQRECKDYLLAVSYFSLNLGRISALCETMSKESIADSETDCEKYIKRYENYLSNLSN